MMGNWFRRVFSLPHASLLYVATARCNLNCVYCYNVWKDGLPYSMDELPTEEAILFIQKVVKESNCAHFTFTGGEPTLRPDLEELVRAASALCQRVNLITNGTLLTERRIDALSAAGVSLFELTLNSADRNIHNRMAGGIDCFDKVTQAAAKVRSRGGDLAFVFVGTSENIEDWENALQLGIALGAQGFLFNRYNAGGCRHDNPETLMPSVNQVRGALAIAEQYAAKYGVGVSASVPIPPCLIDTKDYPHVGFGFCPVGTKRAYWTIDPLGNVRPCNHSPTILGNVFKESFSRIIRSQKLTEFKKAQPPSCSTCKIRRNCQGGCKAAAQACYGSIWRREPFLELTR
jgi:radical SAM protein with 4Fe4S-binding SPASM domain